MTDRPATLKAFAELRDKLIRLKEDRSTYIKSADVLLAHDDLCTLLQRLDTAAGSQPAGDTSSPPADG